MQAVGATSVPTDSIAISDPRSCNAGIVGSAALDRPPTVRPRVPAGPMRWQCGALLTTEWLPVAARGWLDGRIASRATPSLTIVASAYVELATSDHLALGTSSRVTHAGPAANARASRMSTAMATVSPTSPSSKPAATRTCQAIARQARRSDTAAAWFPAPAGAPTPRRSPHSWSASQSCSASARTASSTAGDGDLAQPAQPTAQGETARDAAGLHTCERMMRVVAQSVRKVAHSRLGRSKLRETNGIWARAAVARRLH